MTKNFECPKCNKIYSYKSDYDRHINRKISCNEDEKKQYEIIKKTCINCGKIFKRYITLKFHLENKCKIIHEKQYNHDINDRDVIHNYGVLTDQNKEDLLEKLLKEKQKHDEEMAYVMKEMHEMKETLTKLQIEKPLSKKISVKGNLIKGNNTNNIQQNIHNDIKIIAFGKEDLSYITNSEFSQILNKGFKSVPNLVEYIHFNVNKPENHNIYISNMRDNHVLMFDGETWQLKERDAILQDMIDNNTDILIEKFDELIKTLDEGTIKKFKRFLDEKDESKVADQIKKDLKLLLYNNKKISELKPRISMSNHKPISKAALDAAIAEDTAKAAAEALIIKNTAETVIVKDEPKEEIVIKTEIIKPRKTKITSFRSLVDAQQGFRGRKLNYSANI